MSGTTKMPPLIDITNNKDDLLNYMDIIFITIRKILGNTYPLEDNYSINVLESLVSESKYGITRLGDVCDTYGLTLVQAYFILCWDAQIKAYNEKMCNMNYQDTLGNVIKENDWVLLFNKDNNPQKWSAEKVVESKGVLCTVFHKTMSNIYTDLRTIPSNMLVIITTGGENQIFQNDEKIIVK